MRQREREATLIQLEISDKPRTEKPWGYELRWAITDKYLGKVLHIKRGEALSLQYHNRKDESILMLNGQGEHIRGQASPKESNWQHPGRSR